jgi:putative transposase
MSHSYTSLAYHFVFATKYRHPFLSPDFRPHILAYLADTAERLGGRHIITNGPEDHVHQLCFLPPDITVSEFMRVLKSNSSGWVHRTFTELKDFSWQTGYGAFTVGRRELATIERYIARQIEHHRKRPLLAELTQIYREHGLSFDERSLLD